MILNEKAFLAKAVQVLRADWVELDSYLQQACWQQAADKAHQLQGIFYLLQSETLADKLTRIEQKSIPPDTMAVFRKQLKQQIDCFCTELENQAGY